MQQAITRTRTGQHVNQLKRFIRDLDLIPQNGVMPLTIPAATAAGQGISQTFAVEAPQDALCEVYGLVGLHGTPPNSRLLKATIYEQTRRRYLSNGQVPLDHCFGNALRPCFLMESLALEPQQPLQFQFFSNDVAGPNTFSFLARSARHQDINIGESDLTRILTRLRQRKGLLFPYWLVPPGTVNVPALGTAEVIMGNLQHQLFLAFQVMGTVVTGGLTRPPEIWSWEMWDSRDGRAIQGVPVASESASGDAQFPYWLPEPMFVEPDTPLRMRITNHRAVPLQLEVSVHGVAYSQAPGAWEGRGRAFDMPQGGFYARSNL